VHETSQVLQLLQLLLLLLMLLLLLIVMNPDTPELWLPQLLRVVLSAPSVLLYLHGHT
jgi:hypothetical protein